MVTTSSEAIDSARKAAYFMWRKLPPWFDLDDIQSEAVLGALQAREGCEVIAAKRAVIQYLRRCNPGSRGTGKQCLLTVWWMPTEEATQERDVIGEEMRQRVIRAVDTLTVKELAVIRACYWQDSTQAEAARRLGTTGAYFARVKAKALAKMRLAIGEECAYV